LHGPLGAEMLGTLGPDCILLADCGYDSDGLRAKISNLLRNKVERFFHRIKHYRAIATRYDKQDANFLASVKLAAIRIWIGFNESVT
jgi:hypothetical protein